MRLSIRAPLWVAALCLAGVTASSLQAAEFHLDDRTVSGEWIGEADGIVHVLTLEGKREKFDRDEVLWIDWHSPVPAELADKIVKARERFIHDRRKIARALIKELERADGPERGSLMARFDGFDEAQSLHAFSDGLESKKLFVREFSFERLSGFESEAAVVPFVRVHLKTRDPEYAARALEIARAKQPDLTRRLYEYVSQSAGLEHRVRAVKTLEEIGDRQSLPSLVKVLHFVDMNIRATLAQTKEIKEVSVNLGGTTQAAQNVTIDLPQLELIEVQTSIRLPVESLRRVEAVTLKALKTISGRSLGSDVGAWADYVQESRE